MDLHQEVYQRWLSEDGLMKLEITEKQPPFQGSLNTVHNHNGILWLVYYYYLSDEILTFKDFSHFRIAVSRLEVEPGLYHRRPGDVTLLNSMDNEVAIAAGSVITDSHLQFDMYDYGSKYGWTFNNLEPKTVSLRQWRQGSDVAFIKMVCLEPPAPWEFAWLIGGALFNLPFNMETHFSEWGLMWLRLKAISITLKKKSDFIRGFHRAYYLIADELFKLYEYEIKRRGGYRALFGSVGEEGHPVRQAALRADLKNASK